MLGELVRKEESSEELDRDGEEKVSLVVEDWKCGYKRREICIRWGIGILSVSRIVSEHCGFSGKATFVKVDQSDSDNEQKGTEGGKVKKEE